MKQFVTLIITLFFAATGSLLAEETQQASVTPNQFGSITVHINGGQAAHNRGLGGWAWLGGLGGLG